jgi:hypothetical protein
MKKITIERISKLTGRSVLGDLVEERYNVRTEV